MVQFLFDMDGTVTARETLPMIAAHYGLLDEVEELTRKAVSGEVPFDECFVHRVEKLGHLPVDEVRWLVEGTPLHTRVADFIAHHKGQCAIVTSNLDCWCGGLLEHLGCRAHCSTARVRDNYVAGVEDVLRKAAVVGSYKASGHRVVYIGDGYNDLEAMRCADVAIAVGFLPGTPAAGLAAVTDHVFDDELALCHCLEGLVETC